MNKFRIGGFLLAAAALCFAPSQMGASPKTPRNILESKRLSFEPNRGQSPDGVEFVAHGKRSNLFLTRGRAVLSLLRGDRQLRLEMRFPNANLQSTFEGIDRLPGTANYFLGADPGKWRTSIPRYGKVLRRGIYPGIDLAYYGINHQLEYDFIVAPGADPRAIRVEFAGQDRIRVDSGGDLVLTAGGHEFRQHKPEVYQEIAGKRQPVGGRYVVHGSSVSFEVGAYDRSRTLVIDPLFGYSSYLGGNDEENGVAVATDSAANLYMTGWTESADFTISSGTFQSTKPTGNLRVTYVTKIEPDSETLIYSAYIGPGVPNAIAVDAAGNAYITGPNAGSFPLTPGAAGTANGGYVAKLSPNGTQLLYSTTVPGATSPVSIALDPTGAAYICGSTARLLQTTAGVFQPTFPGTSSIAGFVAKIKPDGKSFGYVTYFGQPTSGQGVTTTSITADAAGNAYITGNTRATDLLVTANAPQPKVAAGDDTFVFKLNPTGSAVVFGTYLGGTGADFGGNIALDGAGNIYVAGFTTSGPFPTTSNAYLRTVPGFGGAAWLAKYSSDYRLLFSTYVADVTSMNGMVVDRAGNAYLTGEANFNSDLRTTSDAMKTKPDRSNGVKTWVAKLDPTGTNLMYGTYFGGTKDDTSASIAIDPDASIYVTGNTFSTDLPVALNPVQKTHNSNLQARDAFVTQFVEPPSFDPANVLNAASYTGGPVAAGEIITIYGFSLGPKVLKTYNITNNKFDSTLARTKITFDGVPAPIIYASWGQTSVVVPYSVAGKSTTQVVVEYKGRVGAPVTLQVANAAPGVFTAAATGSGQGAILLEDFSVNGLSNAVPRGRAAMVFMTVGGENGTDGLLAQGIAQHPIAVTATIGGKPATVIYAGPSPGLIWGLTQVNVIIPDDAPTGAAVPIAISFGNRSTQAGVTIAIK